MKPVLLPVLLALVFFAACSPARQIGKSARQNVLQEEALRTAHVGISIYDPAEGKYLYNYQGDKHFVPASNTKIPTCYAAMKYLGDSLLAATLEVRDSAVTVYPAGDPTFLHREFAHQPLYSRLKDFRKVALDVSGWRDEALGSGWSWNDYNEAYMAERSPLPLYGNVVRFTAEGVNVQARPAIKVHVKDLEGNTELRALATKNYEIRRSLGDNFFELLPTPDTFTVATIPFRTGADFVAALLRDTLSLPNAVDVLTDASPRAPSGEAVYSQLTDSLLKPMMHRSDNFFAEQSLLMVSHKVLGVMDDARIIDTILKTDFKDLPQRPRWVDGSGLSRYNLFTPQDFVAILNKMHQEFGMERIKEVFPTGNDGTLRNYYVADSGYFFAKTGTLSGVVALSGYMYTNKNKLLLFSVLVNNHQASATAVRRAIEKFLQGTRREN